MALLSREEYESVLGESVDSEDKHYGIKFAGERDVETQPTWGDTLGANWRHNTPIGTGLAYAKDYPEPLTADERATAFDPYSVIPEGIEGSDKEASYLDAAISPRHAAHWESNRQRDLEDIKTLHESSLTANIVTGIPAILAGDPLMIPTYILPASALLNAGRLAKFGFKSALAAEAGITLAATGASEAVMHPFQPERTKEETLYTMGGSVVLTGLLSALTMGLPIAVKNANLKAIDDEMKADVNPIVSEMMGDVPKHGGAAETLDILPKELELKIKTEADELVANGSLKQDDVPAHLEARRVEERKTLSQTKHPLLYRIIGWINPNVRIATSENDSVRTLGSQLVNDSLQRLGNKFGIAKEESAEAVRDSMINKTMYDTQMSVKEGYVGYRKSLVDSGDKPVSKAEFSELVAKALRNKDKAIDGNAEVTRVAKHVRAKILQPLEDRMLARGLLDKEYVGMENITRDAYESVYAGADGVPLVEPEIVAKLFNEDGSIKMNNIGKLTKEDRELLESNGHLTSRAKLPDGDESYLHRLWDKDLIESDPASFEDFLTEIFRGKGRKALDKKLAKAQQEVDELTAELNDPSAAGAVKPKKSELTADKKEHLAILEVEVQGYKKALKDIDRKISSFTVDNQQRLSTGKRLTLAQREGLDSLHARKEALEKDIAVNMKTKRDVRGSKLNPTEKLANAKWKLQRAESAHKDGMFLLDSQSAHAAEEVRMAILNDTYNISNPVKSFEVGPLKQRSIDIPSSEVQDYLVNDLGEIMNSYSMNVSPKLALNERFDLYGKDPDRHIQDLINSALHDFDRQYKAAPADQKPKLLRQRKQAKKDLEGMFEQLMNRYSQAKDPDGFFSQAAEWLKAFNVVTKLGMATVSAIPDIGNLVMRHGLLPVAKELVALAKMGAVAKAHMQMAKDMGIFIDLTSNTRNRAMMMGESSVKFGTSTKLRRARDTGTDLFFKGIGMSHWNSAWKGITMGVYSSEMLTAAVRSADGVMKPKELQKWASAGFDEAALNKVAAEIRNGGADLVDGTYLPKFDQWSDQKLAEKFKRTLQQETEKTVVQPGIGDLPLVSRGVMGGLLLQFKGFAMAANQRVLLASLDDMTANRVTGAFLMAGLGYMSYALRESLKGNEVKTDFDTVVKESIDRSGMFAFWQDPNAMVEKLSRGEYSAYKLLGMDGTPTSRMASRNIPGMLMGVSAGAVVDTATLAGAIATGEYSEADVRAGRRVLPLNNHFILYRGFSEIEKAVGSNQ